MENRTIFLGRREYKNIISLNEDEEIYVAYNQPAGAGDASYSPNRVCKTASVTFNRHEPLAIWKSLQPLACMLAIIYGPSGVLMQRQAVVLTLRREKSEYHKETDVIFRK